MCDAGCTVIFKPHHCVIKYKDKTVITGKKCPRTNLWLIPINEHANHIENSSFDHNNNQINNMHDTESQAEKIQFLHQCFLSAPKTTLLKAIKNDQLLGFPGLTKQAVKKYLTPAAAAYKGNLHRTRTNLRSIRSKPVETPKEEDLNDIFPRQEAHAACEMFCYDALVDVNENIIYTDLTGKFPVR